ncbi:MAG: hypothetical protein AAGH68_06560 [Pseudomonadota bacterium]
MGVFDHHSHEEQLQEDTVHGTHGTTAAAFYHFAQQSDLGRNPVTPLGRVQEQRPGDVSVGPAGCSAGVDLYKGQSPEAMLMKTN